MSKANQIKLSIKSSETKNMYLILGEVLPKYMRLPLVIDVMEFESLINNILCKLGAPEIEITGKHMDEGYLTIEVPDANNV